MESCQGIYSARATFSSQLYTGWNNLFMKPCSIASNYDEPCKRDGQCCPALDMCCSKNSRPIESASVSLAPYFSSKKTSAHLSKWMIEMN